MRHLRETQSIALTELKKRFTLNPVSLKYPLPERSLRALGMIKIFDR